MVRFIATVSGLREASRVFPPIDISYSVCDKICWTFPKQVSEFAPQLDTSLNEFP